MSILTVDKLNKKYPGFALQDISFSLTEGAITGFIGRNGAGKTTTLKSLLNFVHPDSSRIAFFGQDFADHELAIKRANRLCLRRIDFIPARKSLLSLRPPSNSILIGIGSLSTLSGAFRS